MKQMTHTIENWEFTQKENKNWMKAFVPGTVHTDLHKNGLIPHPYVEKNELDLQWIDKKEWLYKSELNITADMLEQECLDLVFDGLDTIASVTINGELIIEADNMYRQWKKNIKAFVVEGNNELLVHFHSPIGYGIEQLNNSPYTLPAPNDDSVLGGVEDNKVSMFIRKAPYHFGWDWGPRFVTSGIWKAPRLECWSAARIDDVYVEQKDISEEIAVLNVHVTIQSTMDQTLNLELSTTDFSLEKVLDIPAGKTTVSLPVELVQPDLWWTHDLGTQNLYDFSVNIKKSSTIVDTKTVRTGLRNIRLVQKPDSQGKSFYFELNGLPVFIKGANHIPLDTFLPEISEKQYEEEISSVRNANMNMIRVWGGGIYESDLFYSLCDENGLLVWQDFMFACSMYPGNSEFLENVSIELEENIVRLRNHASIALWCGNNEIDSMWKEYGENTSWGWGWKSQYEPHHRKEVWQAYDTIFHKLIPEKLNEHLPENNYWPSSPLSELTYDENQHSSLKSHKGDIHFWNVWHSRAPIEDYNNFIGRFMSEYGFQSFPERSTYGKITEDHNLSIESDIVNHHQKNKSGNDLILYYLNQYFKAPKSFEGYIYMSQQLQAYAFDTATRAHRKAMPYCMGTLYWQINDSWPGASWSTIDYYGNWKAGHYAVKEAYKETILVYEEKDSQILVHGVTDSLKDRSFDLKMYHAQFDSETMDHFKSIHVTVPKQSSTLILEIDKASFSNQERNNSSYLYAELINESGETVEMAVKLFDKLKNISLVQPDITYSSEQINDDIEFVIESDKFAKGVYLQTSVKGKFEYNHFDLVPGKKRTVRFIPAENTKSDLDTDLKISSMIDYY